MTAPDRLARQARTPPDNAEVARWQGAAYQIIHPAHQSLPLVFASPHSGRRYSPGFLAAARLSPQDLRRSEDAFVDELFAAAPGCGAPLIRALFPRAYVDPNREPFELDPDMFHEPLPGYVNHRSPRVAAGLGTLARVVANGAEIYRGRLGFAEALSRLQTCYWPYHEALTKLIETTQAAFGYCLLIDCHSMPSCSAPQRAPGDRGAEVVLGDCHGTACASAVTARAEAAFGALGWRVARNQPYAGGHVTRHYGRPRAGVHALQIEINRGLYMDEVRMVRKAALPEIADKLKGVIHSLGCIPPEALLP